MSKETLLLQSKGYTDICLDHMIGRERATVKVNIIEAKKDEKSVVIRLVESPEEEKEEFEREYKAATVVMQMNHPNIVKINQVFIEGDFLFIEMPKYSTDMHEIVKENMSSDESTCLPSDLIFLVAYQLANALVFLSSKKIIHKDISLSNLFVEEFNKEKGILKIVLADFETMEDKPPTDQYGEQDDCDGSWSGAQVTSPPEFYSERFDIWQLGAIIYQMITGDFDTRFRNLNSQEVKELLYGTNSKNEIVFDTLNLHRLRNSYMVPYLWSCFQNHEKRIPPSAIMEEILAQFYFYVANTKQILTIERKQKPKEFFVLNFFQHLATNEDKFTEILKMESNDMNDTELYIKNVFNSMFGNEGVFKEGASNNELKKYSVYFNKFQGFYLLFTGKFVEAKEIFDNVLEINPHDFTSFNNKALVDMALAKRADNQETRSFLSDAKTSLKNAINNDPYYVSALVNLANIYEYEGDSLTAADYYDKACKHSRIDRQKFNSHLNRAIFKAQQLNNSSPNLINSKMNEIHHDMNILFERFSNSPTVHATNQLIKWMQLCCLPTSSHEYIKLENEILEQFLHSENEQFQRNIPFQLYKTLFHLKKKSVYREYLNSLRTLLEETNVQPKILFCSTIVNRFSLQYFENGDIKTIPLFKDEILDILNEIDECEVDSISIQFDDLVQLSRGNYSSLKLKFIQ